MEGIIPNRFNAAGKTHIHQIVIELKRRRPNLCNEAVPDAGIQMQVNPVAVEADNGNFLIVNDLVTVGASFEDFIIRKNNN